MKKIIFLILFGAILICGCSKDSLSEDLGETGGGDTIENPAPGDSRIVSGNADLNNFLITSHDESVFTIDAATGQEQEIYTFADLTDIEILPEYENGRIFVTTDDNAVNALDMSSRSLLWDTPMLEYKFNSSNLSEPVCLDGVCYASGGFGVVVAVDENTGDLKWHYSTDPDGELDNVLNDNDTPIVNGDKVYIFSEEGFIRDLPAFMHVLDKQTGNLLDKVELPFEITGTPLFVGDTIFLPAKNLYAIDRNTFEIRWIFEANGVGAPSVSGDKLVIGGIPKGQTVNSALYCLDSTTGSIIWEKDTGFDTIWDPLIVENVVFGNYEEAASFAFATNGRPFALNLSSGEQLWFRDDVVIDHSPVYANGRLFFHGHDIDRTPDIDENVGLISMDANTGEVLWLNNLFRTRRVITPLAVADNGVFGPSSYRGK